MGEVISLAEYQERITTVYNNNAQSAYYGAHLQGDLVIDGTSMGNVGRFINHSCDPNCKMQKWLVNREHRIGLFALRDIEILEELTNDYNFDQFNPDEVQVCYCGSSNCRGTITKPKRV